MLKKQFLRMLAAFAVSAAMSSHAAPPDAGTPAPGEAKPLTGKVKATIETSKGNIELELDADKAPISVNNFVAYVKKGFYEGTIFHRVIKDFMIQGGGFTTEGQQKTADKPIPLESKNGLSNKRGTIAMARTSDPNSATAQFYINVADNAGLDLANCPDGYGYTVFGKVTKGMDVADAIVSSPTNPGDSPKDIIKINKVVITP